MRGAVFLDRDGVVIEDVHLLTSPDDLRILKGVPQALSSLRGGGFELVIITNQAVIARGQATEQEVRDVQARLEELLLRACGPPLDGFYYCPHHPQATLARYRVVCDCRKPRPGLLLRAAQERQLDLSVSFMVGDRVTDIIAGARAGCRTVLVQTGRHAEPPIETGEPIEDSVKPDYVCPDLQAAAEWILKAK